MVNVLTLGRFHPIFFLREQDVNGALGLARSKTLMAE
jgi:hypothetical protein